MDAANIQTHYVFLQNAEAWCEGDDNFSKIMDGLKKADQKDLALAFVEVSAPLPATTSIVYRCFPLFLTDPRSNWNFLPDLPSNLPSNCNMFSNNLKS
jgi:hypothetical protein